MLDFSVATNTFLRRPPQLSSQKGDISEIQHPTQQKTSRNSSPDRFNLRSIPSHRRFAKIFGYTGALIQAFFITKSYLRFQTTTNVYITNPQTTELPAFSLCFFFKLSELQFQGNQTLDISSMTLSQINTSVPSWEDYVISCEVLSSGYRFENCLKITSKLVQYLSLYSKCYTLFENQFPVIVYDKNKIGSDWMINVILNVSRIYTNNIGVYLTHSTDDLDESLGNPSFIQFDSYNYNRASITFERTLIKRLPSPYNPPCRDYSKNDCRNRQTCIKRCIVDTSYKHFHAWVDRRYVKVTPEYGNGRFTSLSETNITTYCHSIYPEMQCIDYLYNSVCASQIMNPFRTNDTYQINVAFPLGKFTEVHYVGLQSFIEFICYVTSIVSLWTEISMIRIAEQLLQFLMMTPLRRRINFPIESDPIPDKIQIRQSRFPPVESWARRQKATSWTSSEHIPSSSFNKFSFKKAHPVKPRLRRFY